MLNREKCIADMIRYKKLKAEAKRLTDECEILRGRIFHYMDETGKDRVSDENISAIRYRQQQKKLDVKSLEFDHPELVEDYRYEKTIVGLKVL